MIKVTEVIGSTILGIEEINDADRDEHVVIRTTTGNIHIRSSYDQRYECSELSVELTHGDNNDFSI